MAKLAAKKCPNCGAPIKLKPGAQDVQCEYCGNSIHVEWGKKPPVAPQPLTVYVKPQVPAILRWLVGVGLLAPLVAPFSLFVLPKLHGVVAEVAQQSGIGAVVFPMTCGVNQEVTIAGQTYEGPGPLVTGDVNCKIRIRNSTLKSDVVVLAKNLVEISVEESTLEGKEAAVKLGMNSKLYTSKRAVLKGGEAAIFAGVNAELRLDDSTVESTGVALHCDANCKLSASGSRIAGTDYGVRGASNLQIEGKNLAVAGERAAIESDVNLKVELRRGAIEGGESGIRAKGANLGLKLFHGARVAARETAVRTGSSLQLEMDDAVIDGGEIGVDAEVNPKLQLGPKARIHGGRIAVKAGTNLQLDMRSASIESEAVALCAPFNIEIRARESQIRGTDAFRFQRKPRELELATTQITGQRLFNAQGCNASKPPAAGLRVKVR